MFEMFVIIFRDIFGLDQPVRQDQPTNFVSAEDDDQKFYKPPPNYFVGPDRTGSYPVDRERVY